MVVDGPIGRNGLRIYELMFWYPVAMALGKRKSQSSTRSGSAGKQLTATYHTRVSEYAGTDREAGEAALSAYAEIYGQCGTEDYFPRWRRGRSSASLKSAYLKQYRIPARMFNGVRVSLEGKVASVKEQQKLRLDSLGRRIARAERQIADATGCGRWDQVHQKRRRLGNLQGKLATLEADIAAGRVRLCFGSKRL